MTRFKIRCSSLPAAFACPGSVRGVDVEVDPVSEPADQGTAAHAVMQQIVDTDARSIDGIDLVAIARRFGADEDELRIQAFVGLKFWAQVRGHFPEAQGEVELGRVFDLGDGVTVELTGTADVLAVSRPARRASGADWKFGRVDRNHAHQVRGYQALTLATYDDVDQVEFFVGWLAGEPDVEPYSMTRDEMWDWLGELLGRVIDWDGVYHPGEQCAHCRRNTSCPAMTAMARRDVLVLGDPGMAERIEGGLQDLSDVEMIGLYRRASVIENLIKSVRAAVRIRVEAAGGVLPDGDGRELRFIDSTKRVLDPILARPVLEARLTEAEIAACTILRPSRLDDAIAARTERGKKTAAIEEMTDALRAAGAVSEEKSKQLRDVRTRE